MLAHGADRAARHCLGNVGRAVLLRAGDGEKEVARLSGAGIEGKAGDRQLLRRAELFFSEGGDKVSKKRFQNPFRNWVLLSFGRRRPAGRAARGERQSRTELSLNCTRTTVPASTSAPGSMLCEMARTDEELRSVAPEMLMMSPALTSF